MNEYLRVYVDLTGVEKQRTQLFVNTKAFELAVRYKNKSFYISSFELSQREIFEALKRATATKDEDWGKSFFHGLHRSRVTLRIRTLQ